MDKEDRRKGGGKLGERMEEKNPVEETTSTFGGPNPTQRSVLKLAGAPQKIIINNFQYLLYARFHRAPGGSGDCHSRARLPESTAQHCPYCGETVDVNFQCFSYKSPNMNFGHEN